MKIVKGGVVGGVLLVAFLVGSSFVKEVWGVPEPIRIANFSSSFKAEGSSGSLEVPIASYTKGGWLGKELQVDFIGAVHLGDKEYYSKLNERFKDYDKVLFELVSDTEMLKNMQVPGQGSSTGSSGNFQKFLADLLGVAYQVDEINYKAPNFVHADMTMTEFKGALNERLPNIIMYFIKMLMSGGEELNKDASVIKSLGLEEDIKGLNLLGIALMGPSEVDQKRLRRIFSQILVASGELTKEVGPVDELIIKERNTAALKVLKKEIESGSAKRIAIFYGSAHYPDFHERLEKEFGLKFNGTEWLKVWSF